MSDKYGKIQIDADDSIADLLAQAYSAGWCDGYKEKHVEFDWIDEGFEKFLKKRFHWEQ